MTTREVDLEPLRSLLEEVSSTCNQIKGQQTTTERKLEVHRAQLADTERYLDISSRVTSALEQLNLEVFRGEIATVERLLTHALQDVLSQPTALKAEVNWKNNAAAVSFWVERDGKGEDIMRGQGGSVANILSVGLRIFALQNLGPAHRKLLVLDEQDCWLRPDRVPELMRLIRQAALQLGFQMIVISHHSRQVFEEHADRLFDLSPQLNGKVAVRQIDREATQEDAEL